MESPASGLPVMLTLVGRRCVVLGGGAVAGRRVASLCACGAAVVVIAPEVGPRVAQSAGEVHRRGYRPGDLAGAFLTVIATDDAAVNAAAAAEASQRGVLVNRADDPAAGDLTVMAHHRVAPLTIAVDSGQSSAAAAGRIGDELVERLDADWPILLAAARPWRSWVLDNVADPGERARRLRALADAQAMRVLKLQGSDALEGHLARLSRGNAQST